MRVALGARTAPGGVAGSDPGAAGSTISNGGLLSHGETLSKAEIRLKVPSQTGFRRLRVSFLVSPIVYVQISR